HEGGAVLGHRGQRVAGEPLEDAPALVVGAGGGVDGPRGRPLRPPPPPPRPPRPGTSGKGSPGASRPGSGRGRRLAPSPSMPPAGRAPPARRRGGRAARRRRGGGAAGRAVGE